MKMLRNTGPIDTNSVLLYDTHWIGARVYTMFVAKLINCVFDLFNDLNYYGSSLMTTGK